MEGYYMYHIVYLTTNLITNKFYIGVHSTWNIQDGYLGSGTAIKNSIQKYGKKNFKRQILHFCLTAEDAYEWERIIVDKAFITRNNVYNISAGGQRFKIGQNRKSRGPHSTETKAKMSVNNYSKTEEGRKRLAERATGRKHSAESIEKRAAKLRGTKQSAEVRLKKSIAAKGKVQSEETCRKKSEKLIGRKRPTRICPHCGKIGGVGIMTRWHFDNCKFQT